MLGEAIAKPALGLTDVEQLTPRAADAIDEVGGGAGVTVLLHSWARA